MTIQRILIEEKNKDGEVKTIYYRNCVPLLDFLTINIDEVKYKIISKEQHLDTDKGILEVKYIVEKI